MCVWGGASEKLFMVLLPHQQGIILAIWHDFHHQVFVCVCVCVFVCVCARACAHICACMWACMHVSASMQSDCKLFIGQALPGIAFVTSVSCALAVVQNTKITQKSTDTGQAASRVKVLTGAKNFLYCLHILHYYHISEIQEEQEIPDWGQVHH